MNAIFSKRLPYGYSRLKGALSAGIPGLSHDYFIFWNTQSDQLALRSLGVTPTTFLPSFLLRESASSDDASIAAPNKFSRGSFHTSPANPTLNYQDISR
jgi:hypothetical protein